ncbi:PAS domain S-box protein [Phormidium sp. CLA17]|uniref:adenylate/guanylate cyclase domain-containing protein n=1 Tax=Leptolyngbya sp. Cla-17 TaxID=2803751 RepID=UPI001490B23C|nr:adenylate/guanylate cyclase domain-containing protein [Leptolyngbya sp. Cla-17]MBM0741691.1 PAS domain S-box protein [Leptolyngbya sp. Cla-17]
MKKVPLYLVMAVPLVIQVIGAVVAVGLLSYQNGQKAVNEVANQVRNESGSRIHQHLDDYLATPLQLNRTNADAIELGLLNLQNFEVAGKYFWRQMSIFNVGYISYANPKGDFIGVERLDTGELLINEKSTRTKNQQYTFTTTPQGDRAKMIKITPNYNPLTEGWYVDGVKVRKPAWSSIYNWDDKTEVMSISANYPLYGKDGKLIGVMGVDQILTQVSDFLASIQVSKTGETFILERSGKLVATSSKTEKPFRLVSGKAVRLSATDSSDLMIRDSTHFLIKTFGDLGKINQTEKLEFRLQDQRQFLLVTPWKDAYGLDWLIVVMVPETDFMGQIHANTRNTLLGCAIALAAATLFGIPTSRWIARQILQLSRASEALANGQLHQNVQAKGITELETLATSFNRMAQQLQESFTILEQTNASLEQRVQERTASLATAEAELRALFAAMIDLVVVYDQDGRFLKIVSTDPTQLISPISEQIGKTAHELMPTDQADKVVRGIRQALQTGQVVNVEYCLVVDDQAIWFSANVSPLSQETVIWVARDVSEHKHREAERQQAEEALRQNDRQLRKQNRILLELAKSTVLNEGNLDAALQQITEAATRTLEIERASVWRFNDTYTTLHCLDLYQRSPNQHTSGTQLTATDYPIYFSALEEEVTITADAVQTDPRTQELADSYLKITGVTSLLDTPIRSGGQTVGVVCLEQVGKNHHWTVEEQSFARSIADLIALGIAAQTRRRTEEALNISQEKFAKAFRASPDFITITSLKTGHFIDVNESFLEGSGYTHAEVLGQTMFDLGAWANHDDRTELNRLIAEQAGIKDLEIQLRKKNGEVMTALLSAEIIELEGEPCLLSVTKDITDRKRAEAAIAESQKKYRDLVESANTIILRWNTGGYITFLNHYGQEFFGYTEQEILGRNIIGTLVPAQADSWENLQLWIEQLCQTPEHYQDAESENSRSTGEQVWVKWSIKAILDEQGEINEILSIGFDISDRKRAEAALQEKEQYLRLILDNIPQQVFWKDTNLVFLGCNQNWAEAAQLDDPDQIIGKTDFDLLSDPAIAEQFRAQDRHIMETDTPQLHFIAPKAKSLDGKKSWLDISKIPIHDPYYNVIGILGVVEDITLRKEAEEALATEQERSEKLLLNVLPQAIANQLKQSLNLLQEQHTKALIAENYDEVTVLFADIVSFTNLSANISAADLVGLLNRIFLVFDDLCEKHGIEKIKTIGDAYLAVGGLPNPRSDHAEAIANMALDIQQEINQFRTYEGHAIAVRVGINTGSVIAGVIGKKKFTYDLWGDTVNIANRMESHGIPGKIQVTEATYQRLKDQYQFERRGIVDVKGKGEMATYWLLSKNS